MLTDTGRWREEMEAVRFGDISSSPVNGRPQPYGVRPTLSAHCSRLPKAVPAAAPPLSKLLQGSFAGQKETPVEAALYPGATPVEAWFFDRTTALPAGLYEKCCLRLRFRWRSSSRAQGAASPSARKHPGPTPIRRGWRVRRRRERPRCATDRPSAFRGKPNSPLWTPHLLRSTKGPGNANSESRVNRQVCPPSDTRRSYMRSGACHTRTFRQGFPMRGDEHDRILASLMDQHRHDRSRTNRWPDVRRTASRRSWPRC